MSKNLKIEQRINLKYKVRKFEWKFHKKIVEILKIKVIETTSQKIICRKIDLEKFEIIICKWGLLSNAFVQSTENDRIIK